MALVACGRYNDAIATATRGLQLGRPAAGEGWLLALDELAATQAVAFLWSGQFAAAAALAESGYQRALDARSPPNVALWALVCGELAEAKGAMIKASVWLREAIAIIGGPARLHPYQGSIARAGLDALARVATLTGDLAGAQAALDQADALAGPAMRLFDTWSGPIRAWMTAARGEIPAAVDLALSTAAEARRCGQPGCELIALDAVARLRAPAGVAKRLAELGALVKRERPAKASGRRPWQSSTSPSASPHASWKLQGWLRPGCLAGRSRPNSWWRYARSITRSARCTRSCASPAGVNWPRSSRCPGMYPRPGVVLPRVLCMPPARPGNWCGPAG
jgi:hypothetical protein